MKKEIGRIVTYSKAFEGRNDIVRWDVLNIEKEQEIRLKFISTNSEYKQGVRIAVDAGEGYLETNGVKSKGMQLWEHTAPNVVYLKCFSSEGLLSVYNIFERDGQIESQMHRTGMIKEEEGNKIIYRCNDTGRNTDFDKLVFQIEIV